MMLDGKGSGAMTCGFGECTRADGEEGALDIRWRKCGLGLSP